MEDKMDAYMKKYNEADWGSDDEAAQEAVKLAGTMDDDQYQTFKGKITRATEITNTQHTFDKTRANAKLFSKDRVTLRAKAIKRKDREDLNMFNSWCKLQDGGNLTDEEQKLADQFEKMSEKKRQKIIHGVSYRSNGGGSHSWGSEPLADTDAFVVESERSPGGTHRQRKRTARELAALRAAGAG